MSTEADISADDREAILAAATDYIESWLDGDSERMASCLHVELAKRELEHDDAGFHVDSMSRDDMIAATAEGYGRRHDRPYDVTLLDAFEDIATVRVLSSVFMDYLHIARFEERWLLVNVLWQRRPGK